MFDNSVSVIMPVHNQEELIIRTMRGIIHNMTENVKEIIIILDGCTDGTEKNLHSINGEFIIPPKIIYAPNVFEVICTNIGFKLSSCDYCLFIQDDMEIVEKDFDKRIMKPFKTINDIFCISARDAVDVIPHPTENDRLDFINVAGKDVNTPRNIFAVRDTINRGPIIFDHKKAETLGYMDESYAPQNLDEVDIGLRAYMKHGWLSGAYQAGYISEYYWGLSRKNMNSYLIFEASNAKNHKMMREKYFDYLTKEKHDKDFIVE